jgi:hypothetical protein
MPGGYDVVVLFGLMRFGCLGRNYRLVIAIAFRVALFQPKRVAWAMRNGWLLLQIIDDCCRIDEFAVSLWISILELLTCY